MNQPRLKLDQLLYGIAFLLALVIRLVGANAQPLTNSEADLALQALALARGQAVLIGPHPAYLALTTALMFLFSAGDWVARFWPAVMGSLLVLLPVLFRHRIGKLPAVLLAFSLALDPGLLAVSVQAGSLSFALFFILLAFGLWINQRTALAGIAAGMALISGPQVWPGLLGLAAAAWITGRLNRPRDRGASVLPEQEEVVLPAQPDMLAQDGSAARQGKTQGNWRRGLVFAALTMFFSGTLFFTIPGGLSAMAESIPAYIRGWAAPASTGATAGLLLTALLVYELFPLIFGTWGILHGLLKRGAESAVSRRNQSADRFLLAWFLIALALTLVYPARQYQDICWALLPLWGLAARQIARLVTVPAYDRLPMVGHMVLTTVILGYVAMAVIMAANGLVTNEWEFRIRVAGAMLMLIASTGLIAWGWSPMVSLRGIAWGVGIILLLLMVSAGWNSSGLSDRGEDLWSGGPKIRDADLLSGTIHDLAQWNRSIVGGPDLVVAGNASPSLRWLLRDVERAGYSSQLPAGAGPALVITAAQPDLALAATYRGQDFVVGESVLWEQLKFKDWLRWIVFRSAPSEMVQQDWVILWARVDLLPGGLDAVSTSETTGNGPLRKISE